MARRLLMMLWPHIQPFPAELRNASLRKLAVKFRLLHGNDHRIQKSLTKEQRLMLHRKLKVLVEAWKSLREKRRFGPKLVSGVSQTSIKFQKPQLLA
jgi:hypothetical protein